VACLIALTVSGASAATLVLPDGSIELGATQASPEAAHVLKLFERGQTSKADTALTRLLQATPYDVTGNLIRGHLLLRSDPQAAIDIAASIVASNGPRKDALDLMGMAFARYRSRAPNDTTDADIRAVEIETNEKLLRAFPDWEELLFRTASQRIALERLRPTEFKQLEIAVGDLIHLLDVLEKRAAPASSQGQAQFQLARAYKHLEDARPTPVPSSDLLPENYRRALDFFAMALATDPGRLDAVGETVLIYLAVKQPEQALATVHEAMNRFKTPQLRAKLQEMEGRLLLDMGRPDQAASAFEQALKTDANRDGAWVTLAAIYARQGDIPAAQTLLERAARIRPTTLEIHHARAGLAGASDREEAVAAWRRLLDVPPEKAVTLGMRPSPERYRANLYMTAALALATLHIAGEERDAARLAVLTAQGYGADETQIAPLLRAIDALP
jgi:tetratricopeptide (TPR) repeat protein